MHGCCYQIIRGPNEDVWRKSHNTGVMKICDSERINMHMQYQFPFTVRYNNKRAQRALGRSPDDKVKGHSGSNNREPQGHNLNNFARGPFDDVIY